MNSNGVNTSPVGVNVLDPQAIVGDLNDVKKSAIKTLQASFHILGNFSAPGIQGSEGTGAPDLEKPTLSKQVNDLTLRIGLLQDALNQLMAKVSKTEIQQRMTELQKENQRQLEKFNEQMEKAAEAAEKAKESQKKGNVFEAISNWIQAVVSVVSAIVTLVSAAAQILTNPVGAAGLIVAGVALIGAAAVQITLAIDATMRAAGQDGFLSETDKAKMQKAVEILGYIALAGSMIGLIGGVIVALGQAGRAAATITGEQVGRQAASSALKTGLKETAVGLKQTTLATKDAAVNSAKSIANAPLRFVGARTFQTAASSATRTAAREAYKEAMTELTKLGARMGAIQGFGNGADQIVVGVGKEKVADLSQAASELQAEADKAEAAAQALQAQISKIRALIEQLQQELESMIEEGQQTMSIIFGAIDESAKSMTQIQQSLSA